MPIDDVIEDTTDWTRGAPASTAEVQQRQQRQQTMTDGGRRQRASMQGQMITIPAKSMEFWLQVAQLAVLVLIMLRQ